ncbi:MAG: hypothetical protein OEN20_08380 [Gammaproteobacteria bacterium]|nr:hypothetical protein [Gammaproteobacteria bacterium]
MKGSCVIALCVLSTGGYVLAQTAARPVSPDTQQRQAEDLRAIREQRATLLRELQQLREQLAESDARMEATRERVRKLQLQQSQSAPDKP